MKKLLVLLVLVFFACDDKGFYVTEENLDQTIKTIDEKNLTKEERDLFVTYVVATKFKNTFKNENVKIEGRIGDIIQKQRNVQKQRELEKLQAEKIKKQLQDEYILNSNILKETISGVIINIGKKRIDYMDYFIINIYISNRLNKKIKAFRGLLEFRNTFNELIYQTTISDEVGLNPMQSTQIEFKSFYNMFQHDILFNSNNLKTDVLFSHVVFEDGQEIKVDLTNAPQIVGGN